MKFSIRLLLLPSRVKAVVLGLILCAAALALGAANAGGGEWRWFSTIGSAGELTDQNVNRHKAFGPRLEVHPDAGNSAKVIARYAIQFNSQFQNISNDDFYWYVRYRDNGPNARVVLKLKSYDYHTGEILLLETFDSDEYTPTDAYQFKSIYVESPGWSFFLGSNLYYVEATIQRTSPHGKPGLGGFTVWSFDS